METDDLAKAIIGDLVIQRTILEAQIRELQAALEETAAVDGE